MKNRLLSALIALIAIAFQSKAQYLELVKDIAPGSDPSNPTSPVSFDNKLFFAADNGSNGIELWTSDGTSTGTKLVIDLFPGNDGSSPSELTVMNGALFFIARSSIGDKELWKSDGTEAGTILVKDINPAGGSDPLHLTRVNNTLFFIANDGTNGFELWKTDGTDAGTEMVKDIAPNSGFPPIPFNLTAVGNLLYFVVSTSSTGEELWKSDGTEAGTMLVKDINPGTASSTPMELTAFNGMLFFNASGGSANGGKELWKSDGTEAGTVIVKDINPGSGNSDPYEMTIYNGMLFFTAENDNDGFELWKTDGTEVGTVMVKDISSGYDASPAYLTVADSKLYFNAYTYAFGQELFVSDGTAAGTSMVKDIVAGMPESFPRHLLDVNGTLFFAAKIDASSATHVWKSNGTTTGTQKVSVDPSYGCTYIESITKCNDGIFVVGYSFEFGRELYFTEACSSPAPPTNTTLPAQLEVCQNATTTLKVNNIGTIGWYTESTGGNYLGGGSTFTTPPILENTTFYAQDSLCQSGARTPITVTIKPKINAAVSNITHVLCNSYKTGTATITATGGVGNLTFLWSPSGGTAATASGLGAATYTCTIKDANNCTQKKEVVITEPTPIVISTASQTNLVCNGVSTGSATVTVSGGEPPYYYLWTGGGTTATISNKAAGTYNCTVGDKNSCQKTHQVFITQPSAIVTTISNQNNPPCNGISSGAATILVSGGQSPYTYSWDVGGTTNSISGKPAGTYNCTVRDASLCEKTQPVVITEPAILTASIATQNNPICFGDLTGSATISVTGGTTPYSYTWTPGGGSTSSINNKAAGNYNCAIKDAKQCTTDQTVILTQPDYINRGITVSLGGTKFTVDEIGATYQWYNCDNNQAISGATERSYITTATSGRFKVSITKNGCTVESDCVDMNSTGINDLQVNVMEVYPNPSTGEFTIEIPFNATVKITNMLGQEVYFNSVTTGTTLINLTGLTKGVYNIKATTEEGENYLERVVID